jgi:hypothetical protein
VHEPLLAHGLASAAWPSRETSPWHGATGKVFPLSIRGLGGGAWRQEGKRGSLERVATVRGGGGGSSTVFEVAETSGGQRGGRSGPVARGGERE